MTSIYFINNSLTMNNLNYPDKDSLESRREKRILSILGEEESRKLADLSELQNVGVIYSSPYVMSVGTAKYLSKKLEIDIDIRSCLGERILGDLRDKKIRMINEMQENDFDYKLYEGESLNEVKKRMLRFLNEIKIKDEGKRIAVFTHNVAITSLLSAFCEKGFNLDNRLILNYQDDAIVDGAWDGINVIEMNFSQDKLVSIKRIK